MSGGARIELMKNRLFLTFLFVLAVTAIYKYREPLLNAAVTRGVNAAAAEYFQGTIRLERVTLSRYLKLRIEGFEGVLKTDQGAFPAEIGWIESRGPVYKVFSKEGLFFDFKNARPKESLREGVHGSVLFYAGREWFSRMQLEIESLGLEDVQWLDPNDLSGSSGEMKGSLTFVLNYKKEMSFYTDLKIAEPGGALQERFFESLKPYLPGVTKIEGKIKVNGRDMVSFRTAHLNVRLLDSDTLIGLFQIQVPEYNINLNLNLTVKLDEKNAFSQLFDLMGLMKVQG